MKLPGSSLAKHSSILQKTILVGQQPVAKLYPAQKVEFPLQENSTF